MLKKDGHTHTEFCPHGSNDDVELYIRSAIQQGFSHYAITEHAPLPPELLERSGGAPEVVETGAMALTDVRYYLQKMHALKHKYASDITIEVGFEVDYLKPFENWTRDFLAEYGKQLDDGILSVHFLPGKDGYRGIDFSPEDYQEGIIGYYGDFAKARSAYFDMVATSIEADLGSYKPKRIGHLSLCQKFQHYFNEGTEWTAHAMEQMTELLQSVKRRNYELDYNAAGLFKDYCRETYPPEQVVQLAKQMGIPLVYGSDAHQASEVGRGY
ncbi:histidinol-phosphatase HisJ [Listeria grayi]|uniref:Histidinol-phosphatase n=1 Tax=Listeria grayi DSM 20601 TaxID=525367 RepID=D7UXB0_LISGR|nr:histidinol-phosphatase HisJ [Listeria grayi]EFI84318.1 histidinol phosphate phosphatase HisJ family [Listeria grayi DSM 20601]